MKISKRVQAMDASGIRKIFALAKDLKDPIDLSIGQPDFGVPKNIKDVACKAIQTDRNRYALTQGVDELRGEIVRKLQSKNKINACRENILITSAVSGGLSIILPCILDPSDEVIIFDPHFVGYKQLILLYGGVPISVNKRPDFSIDHSALERSITQRTRAIIFNTPENPTGHVSDHEEIRMLAEFARKHNLYVISDEIYEDFVYDGKHISIGSLYEKTITVGGFSKSHAMTGWRVGYLCAPDELVTEMVKVQQYTFVCAPTPFQYAAIEALHTDMSDLVLQYKKKRDIIYDGLKNYYDIIQSDGAFYFFIKYPYDSKKFIANCMKCNLLVIPGNVFSAHDTHFRVSFATIDEQLQKAITILQNIAKEK